MEVAVQNDNLVLNGGTRANAAWVISMSNHTPLRERAQHDNDGPEAAIPAGVGGNAGADAGQTALAAENVSLRDRLMRALADAENTRRQAEQAAADARQYAISDFARAMLAVADNLRRAIAAAEDRASSAAEDAALVEGVRAIERILEDSFERFGIQKVPAQGAPFDPKLHEAVMEMDDGSRPPGTVAQVLEEGYTIRDRLLRPARVAVVKQRSRD
jgi:molecular chaperone GrpE